MRTKFSKKLNHLNKNQLKSLSIKVINELEESERNFEIFRKDKWNLDEKIKNKENQIDSLRSLLEDTNIKVKYYRNELHRQLDAKISAWVRSDNNGKYGLNVRLDE